MNDSLSIPDVDGLDTLSAALAYAKAGWYIGPLRNGSKHPGSRLGKDWQTKTSRDPGYIASWFAGSDDGLFLHVGRSGAIVFDVDTPTKLDGLLLQAIGDTQPPTQSTRSNAPGRGHYVFAQPAGRVLGNGLGRLPGGWGEIRGRNGVIVAEPTRHEKPEGRYTWLRTGPVPELPAPVAELLHDSTPGSDAATDAEVRAFLDAYVGNSRPPLLDVWTELFASKVGEGESRHDRMVSVCAGAMCEARAGYYPARQAMDQLETLFLAAVTQDGHGKQGKARGAGMARSEWAGISAWSVAQANAANLDEVRARVAEKVPDTDAAVQDWLGTHDQDAGHQGGDSRASPAPFPMQYFSPKDGLLAAKLARAVSRRGGPLAQGADDRMWSYQDGVWRPDKHAVRDRCTELLDDLFRPNHANTAEHIVRAQAPTIACDPVPEWINFRNGLLDWKTGQLHPHTPDVLTTVQLGVDYQPDAACPAFEAFLAQVVPPDMVNTVWELIGYLMYSGNPLHKAVMLMGRGRNGKGTLLRVINALLDVRNVTSVSLHDLVNTRFSTASLFGKLANIAGDIDGGYLENTAVFKAITGGDVISAEHKGRDRFDFTPWAVPVFSANKIPASSDTTAGYLSRWVVIPFPYSFEGREDRQLDAKLHAAAELAGIAARGVAALPGLLARGDFELTESAKNARDEFVRRVDQVQTWLNDCTEVDPDYWVYRTDIYHAYQTWANRDGYKPLRAGEFYDRLEAAGAAPAKVHGKRGFKGFRVVDSGAVTVQGAVVATKPSPHTATPSPAEMLPTAAEGAEGAAQPLPHTYAGAGAHAHTHARTRVQGGWPEPAPSAPSEDRACGTCHKPTKAWILDARNGNCINCAAGGDNK